jgi:hypothetical protein
MKVFRNAYYMATKNKLFADHEDLRLRQTNVINLGSICNFICYVSDMSHTANEMRE